MPGHEPIWERPESLRERAHWYRAFAKAHGGAAWAQALAAHLERQAEKIEALQARAARSAKDVDPDPK
jgi:hypothetical protein